MENFEKPLVEMSDLIQRKYEFIERYGRGRKDKIYPAVFDEAILENNIRDLAKELDLRVKENNYKFNFKFEDRMKEILLDPPSYFEKGKLHISDDGISGYVKGDLEPENAKKIIGHIDGCNYCFVEWLANVCKEYDLREFRKIVSRNPKMADESMKRCLQNVSKRLYESSR